MNWAKILTIIGVSTLAISVAVPYFYLCFTLFRDIYKSHQIDFMGFVFFGISTGLMLLLVASIFEK